jgi:nitronate monooxygenase
MLGAEGVWMGTRFVASREWAGATWAQERVVAAGTDDTVLTRVYDLAGEAPFPDGITQRVVRNELTEAWQGREAEVIARRAELREQVQAAEAAGDTPSADVSAGTAAGLVHAVQPAGEILRRIVAEAERLLRERPSQLLRS